MKIFHEKKTLLGVSLFIAVFLLSPSLLHLWHLRRFQLEWETDGWESRKNGIERRKDDEQGTGIKWNWESTKFTWNILVSNKKVGINIRGGHKWCTDWKDNTTRRRIVHLKCARYPIDCTLSLSLLFSFSSFSLSLPLDSSSIKNPWWLKILPNKEDSRRKKMEGGKEDDDFFSFYFFRSLLHSFINKPHHHQQDWDWLLLSQRLVKWRGGKKRTDTSTLYSILLFSSYPQSFPLVKHKFPRILFTLGLSPCITQHTEKIPRNVISPLSDHNNLFIVKCIQMSYC